MKFRRIGCIGLAVVALLQLQLASGQNFIDLDFGSADIVPIGSSVLQLIDFSPAFPGWTGYIGTNVATEALYDVSYLDSSGIGLDGDPSVGLFYASLQAGFALNNPGTSLATTLLQTGLVPVGTQSLLFNASLSGQANSFSVTLNGQTLPLIDSNGLFEANVSAWAGQTATLAFTVFPQQPHMDDNDVNLADIQFSDSPVPEPGVFVLFVLGGLFLSLRRFVDSK